MKTIFLLCLVFFSFSSCFDDHAGHFPSDVQVNSLMNEAMEKSDLPAVVAMAINTKGEKVIYTHGPAVWSEDAPVTPDHIFRIYSMTKLLTSIAALQLVEKEVIGLDDDLSELMPEMDSIPILKNGELIEPKNKITLRHLLTHTSGFGYMGATISNDGFDDENREYKDSPRHFESGTQFLYGTSTDWVGMLVEKLSGMNLEEYFHLHITNPLGMARTFFNVPDSLQAYIVSRGTRGEDGKQKLTESSNRIPSTKATFLSGGGGLFSSPADYTKLLQCLLNEGEHLNGRILTKETIHDMMMNQVGAISLDPEGRYFEPGTCCRLNELMDENSKWGLAFMIDNTAKTYGRKAGTVTWGGYYNTYFYIDYKSGIAASIYSQHRPFNHIQTTSLFEKFSEIIYSK